MGSMTRDSEGRWLLAATVAVLVGVAAFATRSLDRAPQRLDAAVASETAARQVAAAAARGLPAPPAITSRGAGPRRGEALGRPVNAQAQAARGYARGLLAAPAGPGSVSDIQAQFWALSFLFHGTTEIVEESVDARNVAPYTLSSVTLPLLPGAFDAHLGSIAGPPLSITGGAVTVPATIPAGGGYGYILHVTYEVPFNFDSLQTWTVPTYAAQGLWVALFPHQPYLTITGDDVTRDPALDAEAGDGGGSGLWASAAPISAGTRVSWTIAPSNLATYPNLVRAPAPPRNCTTPAGVPLCKGVR
jgi:hypothetical protein